MAAAEDKKPKSFDEIKSFFVYFSLVLSVLLAFGVTFLYQEVLEHNNDVKIHTNQTLSLEDVFLNHTKQTKINAGKILIMEEILKDLNKTNN